MLRDLRFALRLIWAQRWFCSAIIVTLALGIGANTTVFTLVHAVLFKPLPFPGGERLVTARHHRLSDPRQDMSVSYPEFREYRAGNSLLEGLEALTNDGAILSDQGSSAERYRRARISSGLFDMLHMQPVLGRGFRAEDDLPGAEAVLLIGYGVWQDRYGGSPEVIGRAVRVNELPATIVGVMPAGFRFPQSEDLWMPLAPNEQIEKRDERSLTLYGMLKPGASTSEAAADLGVIASRLASEFPDTNKDIGVNVKTFHERFNGGQIRLMFLLMLAAVGFVLLIACANVANMMLGRALGRQREVSIRAALGASRWRIVRQLLTESVVLSFLGGLLGLGMAVFGVRAFDLAVADTGKPYWIDFSMDYVVFGYFAAVSMGSGLLFGLAPAMQASRVDLNRALKDGGRSGTGVRGGRLSAALVVFQFTLAVVLLAAAGLFMRGFMEHQAVNAWLPADRIFTARFSVPPERYKEAEAKRQLYEQMLSRVAAVPGVSQAALVSNPPGTGAHVQPIDLEGAAAATDSARPTVAGVVKSSAYFGVIDLPLLAGRDFDELDGSAGREAAVVTRPFAERFWPGEQALGKRFRFHRDDQPGPWITVVGVAADIVQRGQDINPPPVVFVPLRQDDPWSVTLLARTAGDPAALAADIRAEVQRLDQDLPLFEVMTLRELQARSRWHLRVFGTLFFVFALIALLMSAVGIYAVVAQATGRRTQEIALRMALGATRGSIIGLVLRRGVGQLLAGLVLGLAAAFGATRLMGELLFRVSPTDPIVFATVPMLLVAVGLFACWLPARRASALHPAKALRCE
jgi:predicted permease